MFNVIPPVARRPVPGIYLTGTTGSLWNVEWTSALGGPPSWLPLSTVNLTNPPQYCLDFVPAPSATRFYRAWQNAAPGTSSALGVNMVPALTLNGAIGDALRLDYINAMGPTDAWETLGTVTLTNTTQFYFDVSAVGQPRRLYRIEPVP
jgi:hypothetical protein